MVCSFSSCKYHNPTRIQLLPGQAHQLLSKQLETLRQGIISPRPTPGPIANIPVAIIYRMCEAEFFLKYIANAQKMANEI